MTDPSVSGKGLRLVGKTVEVLNHLADRGELTIVHLADLTGEPRSSLYRLLRRMEELHLVEATDSRGYFRLGTQLLHWATAAQSGRDLHKHALPTMEKMRDQTGLTIYLVINRDGTGVCIERLGGVRVASQVLQLGGSLPLHTGAAPRALLAFGPESEWQQYVDTYGLTRLTAKTPSTPEELFELLRREKEQGYSLNNGHVTGGIAAIGAPIYDHEGRVIAAVSVSGIEYDVVGENTDEVSDMVVTGAREISMSMGWAPPADPTTRDDASS
jgi:DNA-binding IclR family transcriptional regulator